jgi:hypothetical protein
LLAATLAPTRSCSAPGSTPIARGSRCVPPAPGRRPELHFRQRDLRIAARDARVAAERQLEPAAHAGAVDRATTGFALASTMRMTVFSVGSAADFGVPNSRTSAPAENSLPAPAMTIARTPASALARIDARRRSRRAHACAGR